MTLEPFPYESKYKDQLFENLKTETGLKLKKKEGLPRLVSVIKTEPNARQIVIDDDPEVENIRHCVDGGSRGSFRRGGTVNVLVFDKKGKKWPLNLKEEGGRCIFFHETNGQNMIDMVTAIIGDQNGEIEMEIWGYHKQPEASKTCFVFTTSLRKQDA